MKPKHAILALATLLLPLAMEDVSGQENDVLLRVPPVSGEPGEEVTVEFRATVNEPLTAFLIHFDIPASAADFTRTETGGTASADAPPRGVVYNPDFFQGGYMTGAHFNMTNEWTPLAPGPDLLLVKAKFRIRTDAPTGDYPIAIRDAQIDGAARGSLSFAVEAQGLLTVEPPARPRPVGDAHCFQEGDEAVLVWDPTEAYDAIAIRRDGKALATLGGAETTYRDRPPAGSVSYGVTAVRGGRDSLPAVSILLMETPRPAPIMDLTCAPSESAVLLAWRNGEAYDTIALLRNGTVVAMLDGNSRSYEDPFHSNLFTVYTLRGHSGGVDTLPSACKLNEMSDAFLYWVEDVHAEPGATRVPLRIFSTNPRQVRGLTISMRVPPEYAHIRELSVENTAADAAELDFFQYQTHVLQRGETAAGIGFDFVPPFGKLFPAGADQHVLTVFVDVSPEAPDGAVLPVELGQFGSPPLDCIFSVPVTGNTDETVTAQTRSGAILIGESPVPKVENATAELILEGDSGDPSSSSEKERESGDLAAGHILLRWNCSSGCESVRIERDGTSLGEIPSKQSSYLDRGPGPGVHRYRIVSRRGEEESFPVTVAAFPVGVPGTFRRGDADSNQRLNLGDALAILNHLQFGGSQPPCLDAADADDSGRIDLTDVLTLVYHLFLDATPLPAPGSELPWFDPTADGLSCGD